MCCFYVTDINSYLEKSLICMLIYDPVDVKKCPEKNAFFLCCFFNGMVAFHPGSDPSEVSTHFCSLSRNRINIGISQYTFL